jgi:outer membrane protein OmpA-like peptidoglycan-associated protein
MKAWALLLLVVWTGAAQVNPDDAEGCKDSRLVNRMKGCVIYECKITDHDAAEIVIGLNKDREEAYKNLEGKYEHIRFECPGSTGALQTMRNMEGAFTAKGFKKILFNQDGRYLLTMQSGPQWVHVTAWDNMYDLTTVLTKAADQQLEATADAWVQQIGESGRVSVYGINFDTGKASIKPDSETVLNEVLKLVQKQPEWQLTVVGHTDNVGAKPANLTLSKQRAEAVVSWLVSKGIDKSRLNAAGLGDTKPVGDNTTDEGRAQNRRVELVKL